jgi:Right handed beta helix region
MVRRRRWGRQHTAAGAAVVLALTCCWPARAVAVSCAGGFDLPTVVVALFDDSSDSCDVNGDGVVSAADVTGAIFVQAAPASPTPTRTSPTATATPTVSVSPVVTATPTVLACPGSGADLVIEVDNETGEPSVSMELTGERVGQECAAGTLTTSYDQTIECSGAGIVSCADLSGLAPGSWVHSIRVASTGQLQHQASLLVAGSPPNRLRFEAFRTVFTVTTTANTGNGSLRNLLHDVDAAAKPLLIQFDASAFPDGVATTINLAFPLPALASDQVTIDGTAATGAAGNRIIDANGLGIGALAISGAHNHIIGMRFRNSGGANNRDVLSIVGPMADGNLVERSIVEQAASADGIGVDQQAGKGFDDTANVIRDCEVSGAVDKGIKVTTGSYAHVESCWVHDNANGGIQATLGGHVEAWYNLVEDNRGASAQNGLAANALDDPTMTSDFSELRTRGNISRGNGANGISIRAFSVADLRDDYLATNGSSGLRVFNDIGPPASAVVEGVSAVCNGTDGAAVANSSVADLGGGTLGSAGNNAFTQNNLPAGGANLRNGTGSLVSAINDQWEHCGTGTQCNDMQIAADDISDHGANTSFMPAQAHRAQTPIIDSVLPSKGKAGDLLRIFGSGFNVIDGHFSEKDQQCADVAGRNRCVPVQGNCVQIGGVPAAVEAVTPTMLVVRWPFTCLGPEPLVVRVDHGANVATSNTVNVCVNEP